MPRIKLCTPVYRRELIEPHMVASVRALLADPDFAGSEWQTAEGTIISYNRNRAMEKGAPLADFSHVLFVDSDTVFTVEQVRKLIARHVEIVGAAIDARGYPGYASAAAGSPDPSGPGRISMAEHGMVEVVWEGAGMLLVDTCVFSEWPDPWRFGRVGTTEIGEDVQFCLDARERGHTVWLDMDCRPVHVGVTKEDAVAEVVRAVPAQQGVRVTVDQVEVAIGRGHADVERMVSSLCDECRAAQAEVVRLRKRVEELEEGMAKAKADAAAASEKKTK